MQLVGKPGYLVWVSTVKADLARTPAFLRILAIRNPTKFSM